MPVEGSFLTLLEKLLHEVHGLRAEVKSQFDAQSKEIRAIVEAMQNQSDSERGSPMWAAINAVGSIEFRNSEQSFSGGEQPEVVDGPPPEAQQAAMDPGNVRGTPPPAQQFSALVPVSPLWEQAAVTGQELLGGAKAPALPGAVQQQAVATQTAPPDPRHSQVLGSGASGPPQRCAHRPLRAAWDAALLPSDLGRGSLDTLRRRVEHEIVRRTTSAPLPLPDQVLKSAYSRRKQLLATIAGGIDRAGLFMLRLGGALPWSSQRFWLPLAYQLTILSLHLAILCGFLAELPARWREGTAQLLLGDVVLASGCVAGLVAAGVMTGSKSLNQCLVSLETSLKEDGFGGDVALGNATDSLVTLGLWLGFLSARFSVVAVAPGQNPRSWVELLRCAAIVVASAELAILVLAVLRMARSMVGLVNAFCTRFCASSQYTSAAPTWNGVQANIRMASSSVEGCFVALLSTLVLQAVAMVFDLKNLHSLEWALTASGLLLLGTSQILLRSPMPVSASPSW